MKTLTAYYDLRIGPVSYDFVVWLVKAEMVRKRIGCDHLHVVIVPYAQGIDRTFRDKTVLYPASEMHWRLWHLVMPACQLFGATFTFARDWGQASRLQSDWVWPPDWDDQRLARRHHLIGDIISWSRAGEEVPRISPSEHARKHVDLLLSAHRGAQRKTKGLLTITLRSTYLAARNSDAGVWLAAAQHLARSGWHVYLLRDTGEALREGGGYGELVLDLRAALYEYADLNLLSSNGPASLCWFGRAPYRMFGAGVPEEEWEGLFVQQGLPRGEHWPWASPQQRLVYGVPTMDDILKEVG